MDYAKEERVTLLEGRVQNIETNIADIKTDLRSLRNAVMVVSLAAVAAFAGLYGQVYSLSAEVKDIAHSQEILRRDIKDDIRDIKDDMKDLESRLNARFDALSEAIKSKEK